MRFVFVVPLCVLAGISAAQKPSDWRPSAVKPADFAKRVDTALLNLKNALGQASYRCRFFDGSIGQSDLTNRIRDRKTLRVEFIKVANNNKDPSPLTGARILSVLPIDYAFRPRLRGRLTLRRLALRRNPWSFGERVSHPLYRYSCQHSHFRYLQPASRLTFTGLRNAPLPRTCVHPYLRRLA